MIRRRDSWRTIAGAVAAVSLMFAARCTPARAQNEDSVGANATPSPSITLPVIPQIQLQAVPGYGPAPLTVGFLVASSDPTGPPLQTFRWNFGDGQVSTLPPISLFHTYTKPGSYVVTVTATTADGHPASSFAGVIVTQPNQ